MTTNTAPATSYKDVFILPKPTVLRWSILAVSAVVAFFMVGYSIIVEKSMTATMVWLAVFILFVAAEVFYSVSVNKKSKQMLDNIAANVAKKYEATVELNEVSLPASFWESLDTPHSYTFKTVHGSVVHQMFFLPSSEPVILESRTATSIRER